MDNPKTFAVIYPYQHSGDLAIGIWQPDRDCYLFGDGDGYDTENLFAIWGNAVKLLTRSEMEERLKLGFQP